MEQNAIARVGILLAAMIASLVMNRNRLVEIVPTRSWNFHYSDKLLKAPANFLYIGVIF